MCAAPVLEGTNYPSLTSGHPESSCTDILIVGLHVKVYGLDEIKGSKLPIAAVVATHGRCNKKEQMAYFAHGLLGAAVDAGKGKSRRRDVIVVTMDQRNHGSRLKDKKANLSYDENEHHLIDMAACITGGCHDVSLLMDFLAAYLFPDGERVIDEFIPTGISLGGNLTWRLLREEPRIRIAIPIIGLPFSSFGPYLRARAEAMGLTWAPPLAPPSIQHLTDVPLEAERYTGKKILSIHGAADELVPIRQGQKDLDGIKALIGDGLEVWVVDGVGHAVTAEMVKRTGEWVWRWALSEQSEQGVEETKSRY